MRSNAIQWVRDTYSEGQAADPQIVTALASVLRNDANEGVRLKAIETLGSLPAASLGGAAPQARVALIEAVQNDPNTNVRLKAVEADRGKLGAGRGGERGDQKQRDTSSKRQRGIGL